VTQEADKELTKLVISLDKKIDVLINSFTHESEAMRLFRINTDKSIDDHEKRLRELELDFKGDKSIRDDYKSIKDSLIKIVIGGMVGIIGIAGTMMAIILKSAG
jgi:hypothetical protein